MSVHEGHRERLRQRFLQVGLQGFEDHTALELLLFYAQPRRDVNETAHLLLNSFGSLERVFSATPEELMTVKGVRKNTAVLLRLVSELAQRSLLAEQAPRAVLDSPEAVGRYLLPRFMNCRSETVLLLCLDATLRAVDCRAVGSGDLTSAHLSVRQIVQQALLHDARYAVLAHNHPGGYALPSEEDKAATLRVRDALRQVEVELVDHIIVAGDDFVSLADDGLFRNR